MLAEAEDEDHRVRNGDGPSEVRNYPKPSALASKYGVDAMGEDSDDDDFNFDEEDETTEEVANLPQPPIEKGEEGVGQEFGQLAAMAAENLELRSELDERKTQVRKLGVMLEALEPAPGLDAEKLLDCLEGSDGPMDPRDVKIVQLAKKSRNLVMENNKLREKAKLAEEKTKAKEAECRELQKQLELMASPAARAALMKKLVPGSSSPNKPKPLPNQTDAGSNSESNKRAEKELVEARHRVMKATEEARKLKSALHRELGLAEGEPLPEKILDEDHGGGWRGRSEKIVLLKCKVKELESELEAVKGRKDPKQAATEKVRDVDRLARQDLQEMEEARRNATEQLSNNYHALEQKQEKTKQKLDAAKARTAGLENDNSKMRKQIKVLLDKASTDDELVDELRKELQNMRGELNNVKQKLEKERTGRQGFGEGPRTMVAGARGLAHVMNAETTKSPRRSPVEQHNTLDQQSMTARNRTLLAPPAQNSPRVRNTNMNSMDRLNADLPPSRYRNNSSR
jgi:hypothetical protein